MRLGIKRLILGFLLFVGSFLGPFLVLLPVFFAKSDEVRFLAPGKAEYMATKPGRYYLWNDYQTVYHGKSYNRSESIPDGMDIRIRNESGNELELVNDTSTSENWNANSQKSIGYVEVETPGKLEIEVKGGNEERVFSFSRSLVSNLKIFVGLALGGVGLAMVTGAMGLGLMLWGVIRLLIGSGSKPRAA